MSKQYPGGIVSKTPVTPTSLSAPGIWTMNQQAAAQATNTWPFPRDPQFNYVTMLLHGDGSAGVPSTGSGAGASSTVTNFNADASTNNFNVAINGDARSNNFTPYQGDGYYSNYFSSVSDYLGTPTITLGTSFTIEFFVNFPAAPSANNIVISNAASGGGTFWIGINTTVLVFSYGGTNRSFSFTPVAGTWYYVQIINTASTVSAYVNGSQIGTTQTGSTSFSIDRIAGYTGNGVTGYLSNLRVTNAANSVSATPTTPLTAITNCVLLTCQSNRFVDNSTNAYTLTPAGSVSVSPAIPFTLPTTVATYGSGYFDGTGDYLTIPDNAVLDMGSSDFTIEGWVYITATSGSLQTLVAKGTGADNQASYHIALNGSTWVYYLSGTGSTWSIASGVTIGTYTINTWQHVALVRSGSTFTPYLNGVAGTTTTSATALFDSNKVFSIGASDAGTALLTGYISNCRVVKGTAVYTASFTPPTAPLTAITNTSVLTTQFNGGGNNSGFKDSSQFNFPITRNGNTTQGTFTPYGANWSNYFNGSSYFTIASNSVLNMNTYACLECWVNLSSSGTQQLIIGRDSSYWLAYDFSTIGGASTKFVFAIYNGSAWQAVSSSTTPAVGTWYHLVGIKDNTTLRIYINGTQENTATFSGTPATGATPFGIASNQNNTNMTGYISNARFNLGSTSTALPYTANFTSSALPLTAVTGTQLLTCQSNRFVDNSTNALTLSVSGTPSVQRFSPFAPLTVYNPTTYGGSAYFDGSGDYLTTPQNAAFNLSTAAFTVEAFIYMTANNGSNMRIIGLGDGINGSPAYYSGWAFAVVSSLTALQFIKYDGTEYSTTTSYTFSLNTWYHVVAVRNSSSSFSMYVNGTRISNSTVTTSFNNVNSNALNLGYTYDGASPAGVKYFNGYISNARVVAGTAVYDPTLTTLTVPTAPLTAITGTSLLVSTANPAILDNAMLNNLETVGNAAVSTSVKKYGAASMYFDGSGDYLNSPNRTNFNVGSGDFTIEAWVYTGSTSQQVIMGANRNSDGVGAWMFNLNYTGKVRFFCSYSGGTFLDYNVGSGTISDSAWHHVAVTRSGSSLRIFIDGTQTGTTNTTLGTASIDNAIADYRVGSTADGALNFNGYIDDLRVTRGFARYTATFTVPDQAFPNG
jgi:hypothetical protein